MNKQQIIQQAKDLICRERPDIAIRLRLNDVNIPLRDLRELVASCHTELDNLTIIKMIDNQGQCYLRHLAMVNLEVTEIRLNLIRVQMEHCSDKVKNLWTEALKEHGVEV
jgi:hypothetical protein